MPKFADIKKFNYGESNPVDVSLGYLTTWLSVETVDIDPDFQREHVWTDEQRSRYMEFLIRGGKSSRVLYWNHPCYMGSNKTFALPKTLVLVDGKQRLTACLKFLNNEIPVFGHLLKDYEDPRMVLSPGGVGLQMHINNLKTRAEMLEWYIDLNAGGTIHETSEIERVRQLLAAETNSN